MITNQRRTIAVPRVDLIMLCLALSTAGAFLPLRAQDFTEFRKINEAERLAVTGDPEKAAVALRELLEHHKNFSSLWYYLGVALSRAGDLENARKAFKNVSGGNSFQARMGIARTFLLEGQLEKAEKEGKRFLGKEANTANPHYVFAILHFFCDDPERSLVEIDASIKTDPTFAPALLLQYQALLLRSVNRQALATESDPCEPPRPRRNSPTMKDAARSLRTYLTLTPAERNNDFLLDQLDALTVYGELEPDASSNRYVFSSSEVTTKARVLNKPEPRYTDAARSAQINGKVVLQAVLSANGSVDHILAVKPLPFGLTETSIEAAKQIKFTPATKDGRQVSVHIQLEYNYNLY